MNIDLLRRLCETPGAPGREDRVRDLIRREAEPLFDEIRTDALGSLICRRNPRSSGEADSPTRVLLLCHMDEIGFYVRHIDDKGFLRVNPAGGFDTRNLFARRVLVCTRDSGDLRGVMNPSGPPVHIASEEDKKKVPEIKEFFIDLGLPAEQAKERVRVGDMVVLDEPFAEVGEKIVSKALDNRIACWLGIEAIRAMEETGAGHRCEINVVFTVQEEVGLRGARAAAFGVEPDIALGLDTTLSCDTPGVSDEESVTQQGKGVGLQVMDSSIISDWRLIDELEDAANGREIPTQRTVLPRGGQDGGAAQQSRAGCRAAAIVVGLRYIHTVTEMADRTDLAAARDLLAAWLPSVH